MIQDVIVFIFKVFKGFKNVVTKPFDKITTNLLFFLNKVVVKSYTTYGVPLINVSIDSECVIGENFVMNNRVMSNPIGRFNKCSIIVGNKGKLIIGKNVGMSSTAIVCHHRIEIGDNVNLGGNVVIYDTDFHSLNSEDRLNAEKDKMGTKKAAVKIGNSAFIGGHSTILKGVMIGENSIVGACSVVTKNIPPNEIWGGNPAKKIGNAT